MKDKKKIKNKTDRFIKNVERFLEQKYGGDIPPELQCSIMMLETYYKSFLEISQEIEDLPSLLVENSKGVYPTPLLAAQSSIAVRLEKALDNCGCTLKEQRKMGVVETDDFKDSELESLLKSRMRGPADDE